jgi:membrane protein DedA with SNARE-associated domain
MNLTQLAFNLISTLGYAGLFFGLFIDSFGVPIPSEILVPLATALVSQGKFTLIGVFVVAVIAQTLGGLSGYVIGRYAGEPFLLKYGKYVLISHRDLARTHLAFQKYGGVLTLVGRCLPVIRGLIAYPAGIAEMPVITFVTYTAIGSAVWTACLMYLGYLLGGHLNLIETYGQQLSYVFLGLIIVAVGWHVRQVFMRQKP